MNLPQLAPFIRYVLFPGAGMGVILWLMVDALVERGKELGVAPSNFPAPLTGPMWWVWLLIMLAAGMVIMLVIETLREQ